MNSAAITADIYTDFSGFSGLRKLARQNERKALPQVARQFEALFLQMMLKSMRKASFGDPLLGSQQGKMYRDLYDQQLALSMSQADAARGGHGLGLAAMLERQLGKTLPQAARPADKRVAVVPVGMQTLPALRPPVRQSWAAVRAMTLPGSVTRGDVMAGASGIGVRGAGTSLSVAPPAPQSHSPQAFIRRLWPQAQRAARELGTRPEVLLAQAALETGWGQGIVRDGRGVNSHNLFNIKADHRWDGARMQINTLEYKGGVAVRRRAAFRAYDSYAASFRDYVKFLRSDPRYRDALRQAHDPRAFIDALDTAGYATDPHYGAKVWRVLHSRPLQEAVAGLASASATQSLTGADSRMPHTGRYHERT